MMHDIDRDYYRQRLTEELKRAGDADCDVASFAHRKLAEFYEKKLTEPPPPVYRSGSAANRPA